MSPDILLDLVKREIDRRKAEESLYEFVKQAWHVVEPGVPFVHGWHLEVICEHLEAVSAGEIRRLLINIPPRHAKSTIVSVMWPMWEWLTAPHEKFLCASYSGVLSTRDNIKCRRLIQSPWYQERWGHMFQLSGDQNQKTRFENDQTGYRIATSVGGTATGEGGSRLLLDDPHGAQDAQSDAMRESSIEWFDMVWSTRLNDPKRDAMVTIMQRLHEGDVSGRILERGGWEHICLPAEYDGVKRSTVLGSYDHRERVGQLLWDQRFGPEEMQRLKDSLGEYGTSGQLQQQPSPPGGGILKVKHFQKWRGELPAIEYIVQSYDTAFTEKTDGDPTSCSVWGVFMTKEKKLAALLLDCWSDHLSYPELRRRVIDDWSAEYASVEGKRRGKKPDAIVIEKKGSGQSLLQDLHVANIPAHPYDPGRADKIARAHLAAPMLELELFYILESTVKPGQFISWAQPLVDQCAKFPNVIHDDMVDTFTQAAIYLRDGRWLEMQNFEGDPVDEIDYNARKKRLSNPYAV